MTVRRSPARLTVFVGLAAVVALVLLVALWQRYPFTIDVILVVLALATLVTDALGVQLPRGGSVSLSYPLMVAILILYGPIAAALVFAGVALVMNVRSRRPPIRLVFNISQIVISILVAGSLSFLTADALGVPLPSVQLDAGVYPAILLPVALFAVVFLLLNSSLVGGAITLSEGVPFIRVWTANFSWHVTTQLALAMLGLALAQATVMLGAIGLALFVVPLFVARGVFQSYMRLREAYADTVRGLVSAIEAKDPYTRGHSERVAELSTALAQSMRLPETAIRRIEMAALLHDLGKVGISRSILLKPDRLNDEEWRSIRAHPSLAADIIGSVEFLVETVPAIVHHHERWDGGGYGDGLAAQQIPMEARILAVADAYDAMTSRRAYRPSMSRAEAIKEILDQSAAQFDPAIAKAFVAMLDERGAEIDEVLRGAHAGVNRA